MPPLQIFPHGIAKLFAHEELEENLGIGYTS
jgi:hypothetical protein